MKLTPLAKFSVCSEQLSLAWRFEYVSFSARRLFKHLNQDREDWRMIGIYTNDEFMAGLLQCESNPPPEIFWHFPQTVGNF